MNEWTEIIAYQCSNIGYVPQELVWVGLGIGVVVGYLIGHRPGGK